jgi:TonB family protein
VKIEIRPCCSSSCRDFFPIVSHPKQRPELGIDVALSVLGFFHLGEDGLMNDRFGKANWALASILLFGCSSALTPKALAQDSASVTMKRKVKTKVMPEYSEIARQLHLQGKVRVEATIAPDGRVTNTKVIGGHPVLAVAAVDAVKKWRFEPGPKETTEIIELNFDSQN